MKKLVGCRNARKINQLHNDENLERHIAECVECQKSRQVFDWMRELSEQTPSPQNLPAPGFLLFKARFFEKRSAVTRVVQPIIRMQMAAMLIFALAIGWLLLKSQTPIGSLMMETFSSFLSVAPLFILGAMSAVLICFAFAYFLRDTNKFKE